MSVCGWSCVAVGRFVGWAFGRAGGGPGVLLFLSRAGHRAVHSARLDYEDVNGVQYPFPLVAFET